MPDRYDLALAAATAAGFQAPVCGTCDGSRWLPDCVCCRCVEHQCISCSGTGAASPEAVGMAVLCSVAQSKRVVLDVDCVTLLGRPVGFQRSNHNATPRDLAAALLECWTEVQR